MPRSTQRLSKRLIDGLAPREGEYVIWDCLLTGFGVRVRPSGKKTYILKYRVHGGRGGTVRKPTIGVHGPVTCDEARKIAKSWLGKVYRGEELLSAFPLVDQRMTPV